MSKTAISDAIQENNARVGWRITGKAVLTRGDGTGTLIADQNLRLGYYWQRDESGQRTIGVATVDSSIIFENNIDYETMEVDLGYKPDDNKQWILGQNAFSMTSAGGTTVTEQKIASTARAVQLPLTVTADTTQPSMTVYVNSWSPTVGGTNYLFPISGTNLTAFVPGSAAMMRYATIFVKNDYATMEVIGSTPRSTGGLPLGEIDINECIAAATTGDNTVIAIPLVTGQTAITQYDLNNSARPLQNYISANVQSGGGGTAGTAVIGLTMPSSVFNVANSPVTSVGTFVVTFGTQAAHTAFMGGTAGSAIPTFRPLIASDIPVLSYVSSVSGTDPISSTGGTAPVISLSGTVALSHITNGGTVGQPLLAGASVPAYGPLNLSTSNVVTGTLPAAQFPILTGDVSTPGASIVTTLATVNNSPGTYQFATVVVNGKGLTTLASAGSPVLAVSGSSPIASSGGTAPIISLAGTVGLDHGGSGADLSATGPGVLVQASSAAAVTVPAALSVNYLADAWKLPVSVVRIGNLNISNPGTATFDGITISSGDRMLLINQSTASQNGIWIFNGSSSPLTRPTDFASGSTLFAYRNVIVFTTNGATAGGTFYRLSTPSAITIDTTSQSWTQTPLYVGTAVGTLPAVNQGTMTGDGGAGGASGAVPAPAVGDAVHAFFGDGTYGGAARKLVDLTVLGADAANIDLTSIPATYKMLILEMELRSDRAATTDNAYIRLNNDSTAADYYSYSIHENGTTPTFNVTERLAVTATGIECNLSLPGTTAPANEYGYFRILIYNYASVANNRKVDVYTIMRSGTATGNLRQIRTAGWWLNTAAAVNRITVLPVTGANFKAGSTYMLYGLS